MKEEDDWVAIDKFENFFKNKTDMVKKINFTRDKMVASVESSDGKILNTIELKQFMDEIANKFNDIDSKYYRLLYLYLIKYYMDVSQEEVERLIVEKGDGNKKLKDFEIQLNNVERALANKLIEMDSFVKIVKNNTVKLENILNGTTNALELDDIVNDTSTSTSADDVAKQLHNSIEAANKIISKKIEDANKAEEAANAQLERVKEDAADANAQKLKEAKDAADANAQKLKEAEKVADANAQNLERVKNEATKAIKDAVRDLNSAKDATHMVSQELELVRKKLAEATHKLDKKQSTNINTDILRQILESFKSFKN